VLGAVVNMKFLRAIGLIIVMLGVSPAVGNCSNSIPIEISKDGFFSYYLAHTKLEAGASLDAYGKTALKQHGRNKLMRLALVAGHLLGTADVESYQHWNQILLQQALKSQDQRYVAVAHMNDMMYKSLSGEDKDQIVLLNEVIAKSPDWFVRSLAYDQIGILKIYGGEESDGLVAFHESQLLLRSNEQDSDYAYFMYENFYGSSILYYNYSSGIEAIARSILKYRPKDFPAFDHEAIGNIVTAAFLRGDEKLAREGVSALKKIAEIMRRPEISNSAAIYCARAEYLFGTPAAVLRCLERANIDAIEPPQYRINALLMMSESKAKLGDLAGAKRLLGKVHKLQATGAFPKYAFDELPQAEAALLMARGKGRLALDVATRHWRSMEWRRTVESQAATQQFTKSLEFDVGKLKESANRQKELIKLQWILAVIILFALIGAIWFMMRERNFNKTLAEVNVALGEAKQRAETASLIKSQFLANVSHEVRTPLNGMLGMVQLMQIGPVGRAHKAELNVLMDSGASLLKILNDLLDMSKIEAGKLELDPAPFDVEALANASISNFAGLALNKNINLELDVSALEHAWHIGDSVRVKQILGNILSNAIKFTQRGGVKLKISQCAGGLQFSVTDSGLGMSSEALSRIFEKFEQAETSTSRRFGGTGLGLSICRDLATVMGGSIVVESELNVGTTFVVTLPLEQTSPVRDIESHHGAPDIQTVGDRPLRILAAEDHPVNQLVLQRFLDSFGCHVTMVEDGQSAVEKALSEDWDLILMDLQMPILDGEGALRRIRADEATNGDKPRTIIAASASVMQAEVERYLELGFDGVLPKPIQLSALSKLLEDFSGPRPASEFRVAS